MAYMSLNSNFLFVYLYMVDMDMIYLGPHHLSLEPNVLVGKSPIHAGQTAEMNSFPSAWGPR